MTDKKEYWDCADDMGTVKISEEVIASIAAISVMEHSGVYSLSSGLGADLAELLGKKTLTRGVKIIFFENALKIDIYFVIKFGFAVCEVAKEVQYSQSIRRLYRSSGTAPRLVKTQNVIEGDSPRAAAEMDVDE